MGVRLSAALALAAALAIAGCDQGTNGDVFQLSIATPVGWRAGSYPAQGAWILDAGPSHLQTTVIPDADGAGAPGVAVVTMEGGFPSGDTTLVWGRLHRSAAGKRRLDRAGFDRLHDTRDRDRTCRARLERSRIRPGE